MGKIINTIKKIASKDSNYYAKFSYFKYLKTLEIKEKNILIEPQQGRSIDGSMFYIMKELASHPEYKEYKIFVALNNDAIVRGKLAIEKNNIQNVTIVEFLSKVYYKLLAQSKFLITDTAFPPCFVKREGQVILNTWHGTPLKCLGKSNKTDYHNIGNIQKNFVISDYLLYPNEYTKNHMIEDYMLENISKAKTILSGYPRNTAFFNEKERENIRKELELEDKEVLVYMPTWREGIEEKDILKNKTYLLYNLLEIEKNLNDNQIVYINIHPLEKQIVNFDEFKKIKTFPEEYETYQFLNIADCLITDYSSVFFDFAVTKRKIILFCYDEKDYLANRGLYFDYNELPFTKVKNIKELIEAINRPKEYSEEEFIETYCKYDNKETTKKICEKVIFNKKNDLLIENIKNNGKENVLIYTGNLAKNGITMALKNLLSNIELNEKNYYLTFSSNIIEANKEQLLEFPEEVKYIAIAGKTNMTIPDKIKFILYRKNLYPLKWFTKTANKVYKQEIKRLYGETKFDSVIQFVGYEYKKIFLYSTFDCNTVIYVHSNMIDEIKTKHKQHFKTLRYAYNAYDKIAIVNNDLIESTSRISKRKDNIFVAENIINYKNVIEKSNEPQIVFDEDTESNRSLEDIKEILDGNNKIFITIGRFSAEKGHQRLIKAFNQVYQENKQVYLIIIGGTGIDYEKTIELINSLDCKNNVITIKSISNPYNILKKCDYFVLSSFYEGFGLALAEADIVGKPTISTDIVGPRGFVKENGGTLVENSQQGLYNGMKSMLKGEVPIMNADYEKYNQNAINNFYKLLK